MNKQKLVLCGFIAILIVANILFYEYPFTVKRAYNLSTETEDGVTLYYDLYEPKGITEGSQNKAIILGHGLMVNKEMMRFMGIELAAEGFVVLALDFRSHGISGGDFNPMAQGLVDSLLHDKESANTTGTLTGAFDTSILQYDLMAMKRVLNARGDIDMRHLGYLGFSMGGEAGVHLIANDSDFEAMVGLSPSFNYDLVNATVPRNFLMLIGRYDEAISIDALYHVMETRTGLPRSQIETGKRYGEFSDGTASELYVDPYGEHFLASYNVNFIRETRNWFRQALLGEAPSGNGIIFPLLALFVGLQFIGIAGIFIIGAKYLLGKYGRQSEVPELSVISEETHALAGSIPYLLFFSHIMMLFMFGILLFPLLFTGFLFMALLGPSYVLCGYLRLLYRKRGIDHAAVKQAFHASSNMHNCLVGLGLGVFFIILMQFSLGSIFGIFPAVGKWVWVPVYFIAALFCFRNYVWFFQACITEHHLKDSSNKFRVLLSGFIFFIGMTAIAVFMILLPCILMDNYFLAMTLFPIAFVILGAAFVSSVCYRTNKDMHIPIIAISLFAAFFFCTLSPIFELWNLRY